MGALLTGFSPFGVASADALEPHTVFFVPVQIGGAGLNRLSMGWACSHAEAGVCSSSRAASRFDRPPRRNIDQFNINNNMCAGTKPWALADSCSRLPSTTAHTSAAAAASDARGAMPAAWPRMASMPVHTTGGHADTAALRVQGQQ